MAACDVCDSPPSRMPRGTLTNPRPRVMPLPEVVGSNSVISPLIRICAPASLPTRTAGFFAAVAGQSHLWLPEQPRQRKAVDDIEATGLLERGGKLRRQAVADVPTFEGAEFSRGAKLKHRDPLFLRRTGHRRRAVLRRRRHDSCADQTD